MKTFYGRVNQWLNISKFDLFSDLWMCFLYGVGYHIELTVWSGCNKPWWQNIKALEKRYKFLVFWCKLLKVPLFVSIFNNNQGSRKYNDIGVPLSSVRKEVTQILNIVKKNKIKTLYCQIVAETKDSTGRDIENEGAQILGGKSWIKLVYNGNSGFPTTTPSWASIRAVHPSSIQKTCPLGSFAVSDHGLIIQELGGSTTNDKVGANSGMVKKWMDRCDGWGCSACVVYDFIMKKKNHKVIKMLKQ